MEKSTVKAVLFDLDGTLLYTLPDIHNCINLVLKDHGYPQRSIPEVRGFVGGGLRKLVEMSAPAGAADLDAMCQEYGALYSA
ncbi:MAG: HAD hydrolase-like protein, partial [Parasporobacterium sp.]|nr:HAD hydrolase-like protein [Parasporobacterium sp.]